MSKVSYDSVVKKLKESKTNITCNELIRLLEALGYEVTKKANGNHHTFDHPDLDWIGSNFDCGHGSNPKLKPVYIDNVRKLLESHKEEIEEARKGEAQ